METLGVLTAPSTVQIGQGVKMTLFSSLTVSERRTAVAAIRLEPFDSRVARSTATPALRSESSSIRWAWTTEPSGAVSSASPEAVATWFWRS